MANALLFDRPPVLEATGVDSPERWDPAAELALLRLQPGLRLAVATFAAALISAYRGDRLLNAVLGDRGRVLIGLMVLYLEAHPLSGTTARGATLSTVQALCRQ